MIKIIGQILILSLLILIVIFLSSQREKKVGSIVFFSVISCVICALFFQISNPEEVFLGVIPIDTLIYLISMEIILNIMNRENVFSYFTIKVIHSTKSNHRILFYFLCISSALLSGVMSDIPLVIIFVPITLRATQVLKINSQPYIIGLSFSISIGNLLSPFATATNLLIADFFNLNIRWFFTHFFIIFCVLLAATLITIDYTQLKKQAPPTQRQINILMEIMDPELLIENKKRFRRFSVYFVVIVFMIVALPYPFLVVLLWVLLIIIFEKRTTTLADYLKDVDWKILIILIAMFLLNAALNEAGLLDYLNEFITLISQNLFISAMLAIFLFSSFISSATSWNLTAIIFSSLLLDLFETEFLESTQQNLLIMALVFGINLGCYFIPQISTRLLKTYEYTQVSLTTNLTYKQFMKQTQKFTGIVVAGGVALFLVLSLFA